MGAIRKRDRHASVLTPSRRVQIVVAAGAAYTGVCAVPAATGYAGTLSIVPVAFAGYLLGQRAGMAMGAFAGVPVAASWLLYGVPSGASFPGVVISTAVAIACGFVLGRIHDLNLRLGERLDKRRAAEAELRIAEEQSRALLEALPDTIYRIDRAGTILGFHTPPGTSHDEDGEARVGKNIAEVLPAEVAAETVECINEALETREVVSLEYQLSDDGEPRDYEARLVKGGEHEVIAIVRDVTDLKELQRELDKAHRDALQAAGTKGRFLATMSHQIRTPMNGVIGMTNVMLQTKLTPEQREYTAIIRNSGEALLSILDDVLDYSKIEAGKIELGRAPFPLRALLEEITELLSARAHDKGLEIASMIDARVPDWVQGDRGRLRQVITNLLGNAIKFTRHGQVVLRVTVVGHDRDTALIRFDVTDTGMGISRDQQKNLFQDFSQANRGIAREYGGTGLGLAISRQIVELMGGRMLVESAPGEGSTFSFTSRFGTAHGRTTGSFFLPRALSGARMLALPLHPVTREFLEHQLSPFGAKIEIVDSAAKATKVVAEQGAFDLVFLELPLGTTEADARQRVRELSSISRNMPVSVLYGIGQRSVGDVARDAGATLLLARPLRRVTLYEGLGNVLGLSASPNARRQRSGESPALPSKLRARVLVAEDNLVNQKVAVRTLEMLGCDAEVAENGALAVEAVRHSEYDIILMDCQMPVLDGFGAAAQIRESEHGKRRIPIIAMTANAMQGDRERCLAAGMDDYVPKPVTLAELDATLRRWLPDRVAYNPRTSGQHSAVRPPES
jgi:two-component system sensor histidine kinase/response regulator